MNLYELLGVEPTATPDEIKQAFRRKISAAHPDKGGSAEDASKLNKAYAVLSDPEKRKHYDETGSAELEDPEAAMHSKGLEFLNEALNAYFQLPDTAMPPPFLECLGVGLKQIRQQHTIQEKGTQKLVRKMQRALKQARRKAGAKAGEDFLSAMLQQRLDGAEKHLQHLTAALAALEWVLKVLDDYENGEAADELDVFKRFSLPAGDMPWLST